MIVHPDTRPKLRPVEAIPVPAEGAVAIRDPSGLSNVAISVTEPALFLLSLFDGQHTLTDVQRRFTERFNQPVNFATLADMVNRLDESLLLEGPTFEAHYAGLLEQYRAAPTRPLRDSEALGLDGNPTAFFDDLLARVSDQAIDGRVVGLIAPHLDYDRGQPCYARAYKTLLHQPPPDRVVILGTNHFGRSSSVVATVKDFATPLGTTATDVAFVEALEARCGDLRRFEHDHAAEHSIELQVCWLQHLFGPERFTIAPFLCPDPCGPTETQPHDGHGVDLQDFARALSETLAQDDRSTLIIAGADFSHVGAHFGDNRALDEDFLGQVKRRDRDVLDHLERGDADAFRRCVAQEQNPTRICSAGCMFTLLSALSAAEPTVLAYHQAVTQAAGNCVTCAAVVFREVTAP